MYYQLFADDSYSDDFYTVAGYVAPAEEWHAFGPLWSRILRQKPRLEFYTTNDCLGLKGTFQHFTEEERDLRIRLLANVIPLGSRGLAAHVSRRDFEELFTPNVMSVYNDPYYLCAAHLIEHTCRSFLGRATKIDFIFDRQGRVGENFKIVFEAMLRPMSLTLFPFLGECHYADKRVLVGLQAADMHASWVRRKQQSSSIGTAADLQLGRIEQEEFCVSRQFLERLAKYQIEHASEIRELSEAIDRSDWATVDRFMAETRKISERLKERISESNLRTPTS